MVDRLSLTPGDLLEDHDGRYHLLISAVDEMEGLASWFSEMPDGDLSFDSGVLQEGALERALFFGTARRRFAAGSSWRRVGRLDPGFLRDRLRALAVEAAKDYAELAFSPTPFDPSADSVAVSGKVIGVPEVANLVEASLDGWLTTGRFNEAFEKRLKSFVGVKHALTVNSGSSANLVALAALTSPKLGDRALQPGDEVITVAAGFPTTLNPILLYNLVPVFVDVEPDTCNIDPKQVEAAIGSRTRAIVLAHTLGNPFDLARVKELADRYGLWLIEDCCDALGSSYRGQMVGTFGDIATLSFYPAHHITMGEGGAVLTNSGRLKPILESIRDWGRDCFCDPGCDNTCGKRFDFQLGRLPYGYDHKYTYSHLGFNLKISDMQAAVALAQMDRVEDFIERRKANFSHLWHRLEKHQRWLILPRATEGSDPAWFGFPISVREESPFDRGQLIRYLEENRVATRLMFAGNLTRQPYMSGRHYRCHGDLPESDRIMQNCFWVGVFPALEQQQLDYMADLFDRFISTHCGDRTDA